MSVLHEKAVTEVGVVVQFGNKYWGIEYEVHTDRYWNWVDIEKAHIMKAEDCRVPTDMPYAHGGDRVPLSLGDVVPVVLTKSYVVSESGDE